MASFRDLLLADLPDDIHLSDTPPYTVFDGNRQHFRDRGLIAPQLAPPAAEPPAAASPPRVRAPSRPEPCPSKRHSTRPRSIRSAPARVAAQQAPAAQAIAAGARIRSPFPAVALYRPGDGAAGALRSLPPPTPAQRLPEISAPPAATVPASAPLMPRRQPIMPQAPAVSYQPEPRREPPRPQAQQPAPPPVAAAPRNADHATQNPAIHRPHSRGLPSSGAGACGISCALRRHVTGDLGERAARRADARQHYAESPRVRPRYQARRSALHL